MEQLLILLLLGIISLLKWAIDKATGGEKPPEEERRPGRPSGAEPRMETEEERRLRRFMEALGLPTDDTRPAPTFPRQKDPLAPERPISQPQKQQPRRQSPSRRLKPAPYAVTEEAAADLGAKRKQKTEAALAEPLVGAPLFSNFEAAPALETTRLAPPTSPAGEERRFRFPELRTASGLRKAFILKEILGPPKAFQ